VFERSKPLSRPGRFSDKLMSLDRTALAVGTPPTEVAAAATIAQRAVKRIAIEEGMQRTRGPRLTISQRVTRVL